MDATDQQLLSLLRKNARTNVATLAKKLGVSRGTVPTASPSSKTRA